MKRKKILYCFAGHSVFGYRDVEMFSTAYEVNVCHYDIKKNILAKLLSYFMYNVCVLYKIVSVSTVVVNFGAWHAVFPVFAAKAFGKKSIVILGGFDAGNIPSLNYGIFHKPSALQWWMRRVYSWCSYVCPTSEALVNQINNYADENNVGLGIGILYHMPEIQDKVVVIYPDFDYDFWYINKCNKPENILSIAYIYNDTTILVKGFDLIIQCALLLPEQKFTLAGFSPEMLDRFRSGCPPNVTLLGIQSKESSRLLYQSHKIYLMPSMTEGLGQALSEAMLCGCLPIGSRVGIIPDLIQNQNFIINKKDKYQLKESIERALSDDFLQEVWRQNVLNYFNGPSRLKKFKELIEKV